MTILERRLEAEDADGVLLHIEPETALYSTEVGLLRDDGLGIADLQSCVRMA